MDNLIQHLDDFVFEEESFIKYLECWFDGFKSELNFWKKIIETEGYERDKRANDSLFYFEKYITSAQTRFLDVGSGPFSTAGRKSTKTNLEFHMVDPLAFIYRALKEKNNISNEGSPDFALAECLHAKYEKNYFDFVHMRNALDHVFNPILGILSMLSVCKVGGRIILRHVRNEAEAQKYRGFHQWNLCSTDGDFLIWRPGIKYNVSKMFQCYVDINIEDIPTERMFKVLLHKKQDVEIAMLQEKISRIVNEQIFKKFSSMILDEVYKKENP